MKRWNDSWTEGLAGWKDPWGGGVRRSELEIRVSGWGGSPDFGRVEML